MRVSCFTLRSFVLLADLAKLRNSHFLDVRIHFFLFFHTVSIPLFIFGAEGEEGELVSGKSTVLHNNWYQYQYQYQDANSTDTARILIPFLVYSAKNVYFALKYLQIDSRKNDDICNASAKLAKIFPMALPDVRFLSRRLYKVSSPNNRNA